MSDDEDQTNSPPPEFDFSAFPANSLFHERRNGNERRRNPAAAGQASRAPAARAAGERRAKKERRRRIDPTTFEKQYSDEEMEFMNAMQRFKELSGKSFPSFGDVLKVAVGLGYRKVVEELEPKSDGIEPHHSATILTSAGEQS